MTTLKTNMLKKGKKGFTLTELAIVIAVIAILIAVLVPTFTSIITKANVTTAAESAHNALTEYTIETNEVLNKDSKASAVVESNGYYFTVTDGGSIDSSVYSTDSDIVEDMIVYTWQDSTFAGYEIATIYVAKTYISNHSVKGFAASAAIAAAKEADTTPSGSYVYATVKDSTTTYYITLNGTVVSSSVTYVATIASDTSVDTTKYTEASSASFFTVSALYASYTITLYTSVSA